MKQKLALKAMVAALAGTALMVSGTALGQEQDAQSQEQAAQGQEQEAQSQEQAAQGQEQEAKSEEQEAKSEEQQPQGHGTPLYIGPDGVRAIQEALKEGDHDPGSVDGIWGEGTEKALREFQEANELAPTGNLNIQTIHALDLSSLLEGEAGQASETESEEKSEAEESESSETENK